MRPTGGREAAHSVEFAGPSSWLRTSLNGFSRRVYERRTVFAGHGDRLAFPEQAAAPWEHGGRPRSITWYPGHHVGYLWIRQVDSVLDAALAPGGGRSTGAAGAGQ